MQNEMFVIHHDVKMDKLQQNNCAFKFSRFKFGLLQFIPKEGVLIILKSSSRNGIGNTGSRRHCGTHTSVASLSSQSASRPAEDILNTITRTDLNIVLMATSVAIADDSNSSACANRPTSCTFITGNFQRFTDGERHDMSIAIPCLQARAATTTLKM